VILLPVDVFVVSSARPFTSVLLQFQLSSRDMPLEDGKGDCNPSDTYLKQARHYEKIWSYM
jgi:hypothetical protein